MVERVGGASHDVIRFHVNSWLLFGIFPLRRPRPENLNHVLSNGLPIRQGFKPGSVNREFAHMEFLGYNIGIAEFGNHVLEQFDKYTGPHRAGAVTRFVV